MPSTINASNSGSGGLISAGDASGVLALQTGGTTAVTIDTSGNVGIGTASPTAKAQIGDTTVVATNRLVFGKAQTASEGNLPAIGQQSAGAGNDLALAGTSTSAAIRFYTGASTNSGEIGTGSNAERMRIDSSGNLLVGVTTSTLYNQNTVNGISVVPGTSSAIQVATDPAGSTGNACILLNMRNTPINGAKYLRTFYNGTTETGSISLSGTSNVLYNISSDYRLKNNPVPITGAKEFVMALQPKTWDWWDNSGKGVGFIAHEFMEIAKYSGNGEKDAVDADGKPIHQSIQPSSPEVMANIVALMQEQQATITAQAKTINALTARVVALEGK